jgi:hypothetical protein
MKKSNNKSIYIFYLLIIIIVFFIVILYTNYYYGKQFKKCSVCKSNEVFFIDIKLPQVDSILNLEKEIRLNGSELNPELNFNNAKGKKLNYNQLPNDIKQYYENSIYAEKVSQAIGEKVNYADINEKYRIFARLYEDDNDFLEWHYDNNFTIGNRYTLVIPILVDRGNTSQFMIKDIKTGEEKIIPIPMGKGVIYNGSITYHKISKQTNGNRRMVIIIPFYSNYKKTIIGHIREYFRNVVYGQLTL